MEISRRKFFKSSAIAGVVGVASIVPSTLNASELVSDGKCVVVETVDELTIELQNTSKTAVVKDTHRGGIFVYDNNKANINDGGIVFNGWIRHFDGPLNVHWFGAKGDGIADDTEAIQKPIDLVIQKIIDGEPLSTSVVHIPAGIYNITDSIDLKQTVSLDGDSRRSGLTGGTEIVCMFKDYASTNNIYSNTNGDYGHFNVILEKKPMLYNSKLLTQNRISNIRLNGNNKDVYGLYFNEMYYFTIDNLDIINCLNSPFTIVYSQFNSIRLLSSSNNGGPVRILGCSTTTIDGLDIESSFTQTSVLDIIHSISTKAGVIVNNFHYEETSGPTPAGDIIKIAQRGSGIRDMFANFNGGGERYIHLLDEKSSYHFDGNQISTVPNSHVQLINLSNTGGNVKVKLGQGTKACDIDTTHSIVSQTKYTDNNLMSQGIMRSIQIITSSMKKMLWFSDDGTVNFFDNLNRRIKAVHADMHIENSSGRMVLRSGFNAGTSSIETNSYALEIKKRDGSHGDYSEGYMRLSGHYLWVDSTGALRISKKAPTSDTDGNIVGE